MQLVDNIITSPPSLNPEMAQVLDWHKSMVGGMLLSVRLIFGEESANVVREALDRATFERHGAKLDLSTALINSAAESGILKEWLYQNRDWAPPAE